jgi:glycosyltransferase involved in cell wall biosynthesis
VGSVALMKKILILNRSIDEGGIDVVGTELAKFLASVGYDTHLAVLFETNRQKSLPKVSIHSFAIPPARNYLKKLINLKDRFNQFRALVRKIEPDIVIAEGNIPNVIVGLDKRFAAPYRSVLTVHNILSRDLRGVSGRLELQALKFVAPYIDRWVAVSTSVAEDFKSLLAVGNVSTVYNAVNVPKKIGKIPGSFVFSAGRLTFQKDFPTLIRAFRIVADRHPKLKLLVAGSSESGQEKNKIEIESLIKNLDLKGQVILLGHISNVADYLNSSIFFVMSSIYEGMPIVALDAISLGKAVVATDVPGIREAVGDSGLYSPIGNEQALAKNMEKLLTDAKLLTALEKNALKQAKNFTPAVANKSWLKLLEKL